MEGRRVGVVGRMEGVEEEPAMPAVTVCTKPITGSLCTTLVRTPILCQQCRPITLSLPIKAWTVSGPPTTVRGPPGHSPKRGDGMRLRLALKGEAAARGLDFGNFGPDRPTGSGRGTTPDLSNRITPQPGRKEPLRCLPCRPSPLPSPSTPPCLTHQHAEQMK
ncbi:hypothetical protein E2C01_026396 [Portunus trituberculatus]|uniref:Uncharacterized protein n=1 Tax=Portunus trituberculatus TaxID=210409 RepID=A0A5B7EIF9_PORTR|nr:hypothetical protein [Portunus trituberculatus]